MSADLIDPQNIPQFTGDLEQLSTDALLLTAEASAFRFAGADVHAKFQGLSACYSAPEAEQLFATTAPVAAKADRFADDLEKVGAALSAYEAEIQPLVARLKSLKARAETFRADIAGDDHWRADDDNVQLNNDLVHDVNTATAAFWQAEITCHNKITALVHGSTLIVEDGAQKRLLKRGTSTYGFTEDLLDSSGELPWGRTVEKERHGLDWLGHQVVEFGKGFFVDGVWGTIRGLGTLVGFDGLDAMGEAWKGLGELVTGLGITLSPLGATYWLLPDDKLPAYLRDSRRTVTEAGKALVAYDEWGRNPARAGGAVTFNVLTTVFTGGAGTAAKGGAVARTIGALGRAGRLVDPMTYIGKAARFGTVKVADLFGSLKNLRTGAYTDVLSGAGRVQPDGSVLKITDDVPVVVGNHIEWPDGTRLNLDDGSVIRPDGTRAAATVELSAADRAMLEHTLPHGEAVPVGAGGSAAAHAGGEAAHATSNATTHGGRSAAAHAGSHGTDTLPAPGASAHATDGPSSAAGGHGSGGDGGSPSGGHGSGEQSELTPVQRKKILDEHIWKANNDKAWFEEHYRPTDGHRLEAAKKVDGVELPVLAKDSNGNWVAKHSLPSAPSEVRLNPQKLPRTSVGVDHIDHLDKVARDRKLSMDLTAAEKAFSKRPSAATQQALHDAQHAFGDRPNNSSLGERLGEDAARYHVIPEKFPGAHWIDLPKTPNGANAFDQLYRLDDGDLLIVEAKAPQGGLLWRKGAGAASGMMVKQGTKEYMQTIIAEMQRRAARSPRDGQLALQLLKAMKNKKLQYVMVKAEENTGSYAGAMLEHFKIY